MSPSDASRRWQRKQADILMRAYIAAWRRGVSSYRSSRMPPAIGQSPAHLPAAPDSSAMSRALAPALLGIARIGAHLGAISPTPGQVSRAGNYQDALRLAALEHMRNRAWTLANGMSVAWAGEQAGYAEAAHAEGLWLEWQLDPTPGVEHCDDCPVLATFPPMPLDRWPTMPGDGGTACNVGCKCSLTAVEAPAEVDRTLNGVQQATVAQIALRKPVLGNG